MPTPTTRRTRNTAISVAVEATYGSTPGTFSPILLTGVPDFTIDPDVVPRDLVRGYFGASEHLIGTRRAQMKFTTELAGSSALGVAPAWSPLIQACGFAEVITASTRVEYLPLTVSPISLSIRFNRDGVRYVSRGVRGTAKFNLNAYERPTVDWEFWGFDTLAEAAVVGTPSLTAWQRPLVITDGNSGNIRLGASYASGAITGGTAFNSRGMTIDIGNTLEHMKMLGGESIDITDRQVVGSTQFELTEAQELTWRTDVNANTLTTAAFEIGPAGQNVGFFMAQMQRINPQTVDYNGKLMMGSDMRMLPTSAGNDELRIVVK